MINGRTAIAALLVVGALVALPHVFTQGFAMSLLCQMGIATIFALSYNMLLGQTGLLSFGHAVYFGLGAFAAMHVMRWAGATGFGGAFTVMLLPLVGGLGGLVAGVRTGENRDNGFFQIRAFVGIGNGIASIAGNSKCPHFSTAYEKCPKVLCSGHYVRVVLARRLLVRFIEEEMRDWIFPEQPGVDICNPKHMNDRRKRTCQRESGRKRPREYRSGAKYLSQIPGVVFGAK